MLVYETPSTEATGEAKSQWRSGWLWASLVAVLCGAAALVALWSIAGRGVVIADEHQFITPGILTLREGLLPYRDYPLFHVPYQPLLNAALLEIAGGNIHTGCRIPAALAAWFTAVLIGWQGFRWLRPRVAHLGLVIAAAAALAVCVTPVTLRACSYAWNHQWPTLLLMTAVLIVFRLEKRQSWAMAMLAGAAVGVASGMRISFLPMLAPLGLAVLLIPARTWQARIRGAAAFSAGTLLALLPCIWLFAKAPDEFLFGNFAYPKLSIPRKELPFWGEKTAKVVDPVRGYLGDQKVFKGRKLSQKIEQARRQFIPQNAGVVGFALLLGLPGALWALVRRPDQRFRAMILLGGLPFLVWGCIAPSRFHQQYWYAPIPWLALLALFGASQLAVTARWRASCIAAVLLALGGSLAGAATFGKLFDVPAKQFFAVSSGLAPMKLNSDFPSPVLTLHPTTFAAAGIQIYPELNSGEFGWRSAHLLPKASRERFKLLSPYDLDEILAQRPPAVIVIGNPNDDLEHPLIRWAEKHAYRGSRELGVYTAATHPESAQP